MAKPYDPKDFYYRKAKKAGLRARSAFKIEEILRRHRLLRKGQAVLDLGAAPGGFLQILADEVGETGVAVGVDLEPIRPIAKPWVKTAIVDLLAPNALDAIRALHPGQFQLVASDMAPKTIGIKITDEARSLELVRMALGVAEQTLAPGGAFVAKVFMGGEFPALKKELAARFDEVHVIRPEAVRESSYEVYVLGKGLRGARRVAPVAPAGEVRMEASPVVSEGPVTTATPVETATPVTQELPVASTPLAAPPRRKPPARTAASAKGKPAPRAAARKPSTGGKGKAGEARRRR
jgi:23S rRNA (uridine2552-2'-O)-methyltransferase